MNISNSIDLHLNTPKLHVDVSKSIKHLIVEKILTWNYVHLFFFNPIQ